MQYLNEITNYHYPAKTGQNEKSLLLAQRQTMLFNVREFDSNPFTGVGDVANAKFCSPHVRTYIQMDRQTRANLSAPQNLFGHKK